MTEEIVSNEETESYSVAMKLAISAAGFVFCGSLTLIASLVSIGLAKTIMEVLHHSIALAAGLMAVIAGALAYTGYVVYDALKVIVSFWKDN